MGFLGYLASTLTSSFLLLASAAVATTEIVYSLKDQYNTTCNHAEPILPWVYLMVDGGVSLGLVGLAHAFLSRSYRTRSALEWRTGHALATVGGLFNLGFAVVGWLTFLNGSNYRNCQPNDLYIVLWVALVFRTVYGAIAGLHIHFGYAYNDYLGVPNQATTNTTEPAPAVVDDSTPIYRQQTWANSNQPIDLVV